MCFPFSWSTLFTEHMKSCSFLSPFTKVWERIRIVWPPNNIQWHSSCLLYFHLIYLWIAHIISSQFPFFFKKKSCIYGIFCSFFTYVLLVLKINPAAINIKESKDIDSSTLCTRNSSWYLIIFLDFEMFINLLWFQLEKVARSVVISHRMIVIIIWKYGHFFLCFSRYTLKLFLYKHLLKCFQFT